MREREGRREAHEEERRALPKELPQSSCVKIYSKGSPYIGGWGAGLPLPQGMRAAAKGRLGPAAKP
jgi:hypothetical protein